MIGHIMLEEAELRRLYVDEQRSIRAIATLLHVSTYAIYNALIRYDIPRHRCGFRSPQSQPTKVQLDEATLRRMYLDEQRSIRDIAVLRKVSTRTVQTALIRYHIPRRIAQQRPIPKVITLGNSTLDKANLQRLYQDENQSIAEIAAAIACSPSGISNALVRWDIPLRRRGRSARTASKQAKGAALDHRA
jgi:hypothetical protein